ncbi:hypothetical protein [Cellulomonas composti]|uniref:hypothetical protein n=1 Tax=Cellulomonas composti TaxID=266130 RepID=UPI0011BFB767|nr:hypothetical protein [Cellulomonas composti]
MLAWLERVALGVLAAAVVVPALRWAGVADSTSLWLGAAVLVGVPVAAWAASTVPARPGSDDEPDAGADREPPA